MKPCTLRRIRPLLIASLLATVAAGQQFGPGQPISAHAAGPQGIFAADLDGDGDRDVLSASAYDDKIAWYPNADGLGHFASQQAISMAADGASSVFAADLDGDGDRDVLSASRDDDEVAWYENTDGQGTFGPPRTIATSADRATSVFAADLDGDGDQDVLSASYADDKIAWYENADGLGTFGPQQVIASSADQATSVFAADLDGDGDRDVLSSSDLDHEIAWYENTDGQGSFGSPQVISTSAYHARSVHAADLDGDGDRDVLSGGRDSQYFSGIIAWYENTDGLGSFGPEQYIAAGGYDSVFAADLDGDGDADVLGSTWQGDELAWCENTDGAGTFGTRQVISTAVDHPTSVFAADLDGDGDRDVLSASEYDSKLAWHENADGLGAFGPQQVLTHSAMDARAIHAADLDGDGDRDLLSASANDISWHPNSDGQGTFGPLQTVTTTLNQASSVFAADLDADGDRDALSASTYDHGIAWYENSDGLGGFGPQQVITTSASSAQAVHTADLDGDGDPDALSASWGDDKLAWYENVDGQGTFGPQQVLTTAADGALSVFVSDLDGDGDSDVLSASWSDDKIAWYRNTDGLGAFGPQLVISNAVGGASSVFAADLDGDGDRDVLSAAGADDEIAWYANSDGLGSFGPGQFVTTAAIHAMSAFAADLDSDGDQDLLSTSWSYDELAWYENTDGMGTFGPQAVIAASSSQGFSVLASDLDGDGDPDVLSAGGPKLAWYENLQAPLMADVDELSLASGGTQQLDLTAGVDNQLQLYLLLGTLSGTSPGLPLDGLVLPLNPDIYFLYTLANPNTPELTNALGTLAANGTASAAFILPPGLNSALAGTALHHAYAVIDLTTTPGSPFLSFASNAVVLKLLP